MATSLLTIVASIETDLVVVSNSKAPTLVTNILSPLKSVPYIYYLMRFKKAKVNVQALIDFGSEINIVT